MSRAPARGRVQTTRRPSPRISSPQRRRKPTLRAQMSRAIERLPLPRDFLRTVRNWTLGLLLVAATIAGMIAMGVPGMAGLAIAHALGDAGFVVRNIEINGRHQVDRDQVYRIVMDARGQDMPLVDIAAMRRTLLGLGWIDDVRVARRLPDTLAVDIVERTPAAILQRGGALMLIDRAGHVLAPVEPRTMPVQLPLVIGKGAENHIAELDALIAGQPAMKPLVAGGNWVGGRRWDLRFQSGELLMLPEGADQARAALATFARKDAEQRLLGQGYVHFDMRDATHIVVRPSADPGMKIADPQAPDPAGAGTGAGASAPVATGTT